MSAPVQENANGDSCALFCLGRDGSGRRAFFFFLSGVNEEKLRGCSVQAGRVEVSVLTQSVRGRPSACFISFQPQLRSPQVLSVLCLFSVLHSRLFTYLP